MFVRANMVKCVVPLQADWRSEGSPKLPCSTGPLPNKCTPTPSASQGLRGRGVQSFTMCNAAACASRAQPADDIKQPSTALRGPATGMQNSTTVFQP